MGIVAGGEQCSSGSLTADCLFVPLAKPLEIIRKKPPSGKASMKINTPFANYDVFNPKSSVFKPFMDKAGVLGFLVWHTGYG